MKDTLKVYVDSLFEGVEPSDAVAELHDEILSNLEARYDDCIRAGMTHQRAYTAVIGTMGDVSGLIRQVSGSGQHTKGIFEKTSPRSKLFQKYGYIFTDQNIKVIKRTAIAVLWLVIIILYFLYSYATYDWDISWIIFLFGALITIAVNTAGKIAGISRGGDNAESRIRLLKSIRGGVTAMMWVGIVIVYLLFSHQTYAWDVSWLIFLLGAVIQIILNAVFKIQINRYSSGQS